MRFYVRKSPGNAQNARFCVIFLRAPGGLKRPPRPLPKIYFASVLKGASYGPAEDTHDIVR